MTDIEDDLGELQEGVEGGGEDAGGQLAALSECLVVEQTAQISPGGVRREMTDHARRSSRSGKLMSD
eukprot:5471798-Pyramimonas_sp.AAC.1